MGKIQLLIWQCINSEYCSNEESTESTAVSERMINIRIASEKQLVYPFLYLFELPSPSFHCR